jgi:hypothetical protein
MPHKELKFNEDARRAERGVNILADAVKVTSARRAATSCSTSGTARRRSRTTA